MLEAQINLRHRLHRHAELSGSEERTAHIIAEFLAEQKPDEIVTGLGGNGLAAVFSGAREGPRVLFRCELDALPINETLQLSHRSQNSGVAHKCGHDGHMAIMAGVGVHLGDKRPKRGGVILLFQPAEETGQGAARVIADPRFESLTPHHAFALHNLPGYPLGQVLWRTGTFASASTGFVVRLTGVEAHAGEPERGRSPALALAELVERLTALPQSNELSGEGFKVTVVHATLGAPDFGVAPGRATVMATLRAHDDVVLDQLKHLAQSSSEAVARAHELTADCSWAEAFPATINDDTAVGHVLAAATGLGLETAELADPLPWSEDFGHFLKRSPGVLFGLGAGVDHAPLHSPEYDFPDEVIEDATRLFVQIARHLTD